MNIFAILGFIAILLAGLWATVQLVKQISTLSFNFNKPTITMPLFGASDKLTLTEQEGTFTSGESATISWELGDKARENEGSTLTFSYACKAGTYLKVAATDTDTYRAIPCNAPHIMPAAQSELTFIPVLANTTAEDEGTVTVAYTLAYTPSEGDVQAAHDTFTILPTTTVATSTPTTPEDKGGESMMTTPANTAPVAAPARLSNPNGLADLTVEVLSVSTPSQDGSVAVRLSVTNRGTKRADAWTFTALLPTQPTYTYVSPTQPTLYAGESAEMLLTFDKVQVGAGTILLTVDAINAIVESVETNNSTSHNITSN
jgi:hypothetical protein